MSTQVELKVNGREYPVVADPPRNLLGVLRDELELSGTKYGCGEGECGACTVLVDGRAVRSCQMLIAECVGKTIMTIEGVSPDGKLHPLQQAFLDTGAMQCGYCTPGMVMRGMALLNGNPSPSRADMLQAMEGNICRCGTYERILQAIQKAAQISKGAAQ